ncbi:MAG: dethiobiotin synthase [Prevotella sp.]|nr:dethiobiotin synthase [Prevotella sp.]MCM1074614.1 dethiobiotin synthase [Ruminococcus sp.]
MKTLPSILMVTGIGTDVGKSYATGWLAREMMRIGRNVITQKLIQTGNKDFSEDIDVHRRVMGISMQPADLDHTTAPLILSYPASPHLAAEIDGITVDFEVAAQATEKLAKTYDTVIIEGAGGALVPLHDDYLTADYMADHNLPAIVVTNGQLGSINHTLLTLEALKARNVRIAAVVYNPYFDKDKIICDDTRKYLRGYLTKHYPGILYIEMPEKV